MMYFCTQSVGRGTGGPERRPPTPGRPAAHLATRPPPQPPARRAAPPPPDGRRRPGRGAPSRAPAASARACMSARAPAGTLSTTREGPSPKRAAWSAIPDTVNPTPLRTAISASATPRPPSETSWMPSINGSFSIGIDQAGDEPQQPPMQLVGPSADRSPPRCPRRSTAHRDPARDVAPARDRRPTSRRWLPSTSPTPGGRRRRSSTRPRVATTGVGSMSRPRLSL